MKLVLLDSSETAVQRRHRLLTYGVAFCPLAPIGDYVYVGSGAAGVQAGPELPWLMALAGLMALHLSRTPGAPCDRDERPSIGARADFADWLSARSRSFSRFDLTFCSDGAEQTQVARPTSRRRRNSGTAGEPEPDPFAKMLEDLPTASKRRRRS